MNTNKQDIVTGVDKGESLGLMEPWRIAGDSRFREPLNDLAIKLAQKSAGFRHSLPKGIISVLASLVRGMNCYYSNLIEGHDTHPVDIERALHDDFSSNSTMRDLQLEAKAHIRVQGWIDKGGLQQPVTSVASLLEIHRRFCSLLPDDLLWVQSPQSNAPVRVTPGTLREYDVQVGHHIPVSAGAVPRFLNRFANAYSSLGQAEIIVCIAAAHHRLLWIHPFLDGNGRVARLMSHAMLLQALDSGAVWSVSRGLARNEQQYKSLLANCDQPRRNDLDGRGNLSEEALVKFTLFFLETCLDQIAFMESLMQPEKLASRILSWTSDQVQRGHLPKQSNRLFEAILFRGGTLNRSEVPGILGVGTRQSRRVVSALIKEEALVSESSRAPLILNFPARLAGIWMPGLFPEKYM